MVLYAEMSELGNEPEQYLYTKTHIMNKKIQIGLFGEAEITNLFLSANTRLNLVLLGSMN